MKGRKKEDYDLIWQLVKYLEIIYEKIMYGKNNINITNNDFKSSFGNYYNKDKTTIKNETLKNYVLFYSFLKEYEDRIKNEYKNRFNLSIKLNINEEENINDNGIKNITCIYTFFWAYYK